MPITQAAMWILSCVFVRFLEDNELIREPLITGPGERGWRTVDGVYGVDVNPFAVAVARFRLLVAALEAPSLRVILLLITPARP